jgi:hypothetical protein
MLAEMSSFAVAREVSAQIYTNSVVQEEDVTSMRLPNVRQDATKYKYLNNTPGVRYRR